MHVPRAILALSRRQAIAGALAVSVSDVVRAAKPLSPTTQFSLRATADRLVSVSRWRANGRRRGTILFSHGALSAPWKYQALIGPWVAAGYDVFAPLHVDSTDHPDIKKFTGYMSWRARMEDMRALADHIGHDFIAAGHSYGGLVALTLGGASSVRPDGYDGPMHDPRTKAVIAFSPPGPAPKLVDAAGYATLVVPALIQTGDRDVPPGAADWRGHLAAYEAAVPGGHRYGLVLSGVDHYFGNIICRPELPGPAQSAAFAAASELAMLFLRGYGSGDRQARSALDQHLSNEGPVQLMTR